MKRHSVLILLFAALISACAPSVFATQYLFQTVNVDSLGVVQGPGMSGPSESPQNASPGTGYGTALYDDVAHTLAVDVTFQGLVGTTSASHIHAPTANPFLLTGGVATTTPTFSGFPNGVTSGVYSNVLNLTSSSSFNPSFNGGVNQEAALVAAMFANKSYWNIHTSAFPGGEIRGFLVLVPEPTSCALVALGMAGLGCVSRRRRA